MEAVKEGAENSTSSDKSRQDDRLGYLQHSTPVISGVKTPKFAKGPSPNHRNNFTVRKKEDSEIASFNDDLVNEKQAYVAEQEH